jgi:hypothetical protein
MLCEDNVKRDPKDAVGWIHLAQYRVQWRVLISMSINLPVLDQLSDGQLFMNNSVSWS